MRFWMAVGERAGNLVGATSIVACRHVVRPGERTRFALGRQQDGRDQIEPQARQIDEVVARQGLAEQMGMHQPQRAEATFGGAQAADVRQHHRGGVADDDAIDVAGAVNERAHLAPRLTRRLGQRTHELGRDDAIVRHPATVNPLERADRARGEPRLVPVKFDHSVTNELQFGTFLRLSRRDFASFAA
jgi:hypothetical protein